MCNYTTGSGQRQTITSQYVTLVTPLCMVELTVARELSGGVNIDLSDWPD